MVVYMKDGTQEHVFTPKQSNEWARIIEDKLGSDIVNQMRTHGILRYDEVVRANANK